MDYPGRLLTARDAGQLDLVGFVVVTKRYRNWGLSGDMKLALIAAPICALLAVGAIILLDKLQGVG